MRKFFSRPLTIVLCVMFFYLFAPRANATEVKFACTGTACDTTPNTGSVSYDGTHFKSDLGGISVFNTQGPYSPLTRFTLAFDTGLGTASVIDGGDTLSGTIQSVSVSSGTQTTVTLHVLWNTLPGVVQTFLGTPTGLDSTAITINTDIVTGVPQSNVLVSQVIIGIIPTPEPMSFALFGSGLIMVGGALKRRLKK